jgi:hypothetical protein
MAKTPRSAAIAEASRGAASRVAIVTAVLLLLSASLAARARADVGATIIERCAQGQSLAGFSQQAYSKALREMPAEVNEYSDCANLIRKAQLAAAGGGGGGAGGGGPNGSINSLVANVAPPTAAEQHTLAQAESSPAAPVHVGAGVVNPGVVHVGIASAVSSLPTPVIALLAFLLTGALLIAARAIRKRIDVGRAR